MIYVLTSLALWVLAVAETTKVVLRLRAQDKADHAKCIAHIASVTSNRVAAHALRDAASRYDSVDGQAEMTRIRNTVYTGQSAMPALWMREQADRIESGG